MLKYVITGILGLGLIGCTSSERAEVRESAEDTRARAAEAARVANAKRIEYQEKVRARLDKLDREMEEERLKAKARRMSAKQRAAYNKRMGELEELKKDTNDKWTELKNATDDNWEKFKDGLDTAGDKLENGWNKFVAELKS